MKNKQYIKSLLISIFMLFAINIQSNFVNAQQEIQTETICNSKSLRIATQSILLEEMILWENPNTRKVTYSHSCRNQYKGCEYHISIVVDIIFDLSCRNGYEPFMVLAMAKHESNYNPFILHERTKAVGLLQLMPNSPFARNIRFIHDERYRNECREDDYYCQEDIINASFALLNRSYIRCDQNMRDTLGMYGSGSCKGSRGFSYFVKNYSNQLRFEAIIRNSIIQNKMHVMNFNYHNMIIMHTNETRMRF